MIHLAKQTTDFSRLRKQFEKAYKPCDLSRTYSLDVRTIEEQENDAPYALDSVQTILEGVI